MPNPTYVDTGIDPSLLAPQVQPTAALNPVPVADPLAQAIAALEAMGGLPPDANPSMLGGGPEDTNLEVPGGPPMGRPELPQATAQESLPFLNDIPQAAQSAAGAFSNVFGGAGTNPVPPPAPPRPLSPLGQANADEAEAYAQAGTAARTAAVAQMVHENSEAAELGALYDDHVNEMEIAEGFYAEAKAKAAREADFETATWLDQYTKLSEQEPNPSRWWDGMSGVGKALWGLSMVFGAANTVMNPGAQNIALNMVMDNINRDVQLQKERQERELNAMASRGKAMEKRHARNLTDATDTYTMTLGRLQVLQKAHAARAAAPGATGLQAKMAEADSWFAQQVTKLATAKREEAFQAKEHHLNRAHASHQAKLQRALTLKMHEDDIEARYDLARMSADAATATAKAGAESDLREIPLHMGAKLVGSTRGEVPVVHKEQHEKISEVLKNGNKRHNALGRINTALEDGTFMDRMMAMDPDLMSASQELAYVAVKHLQGAGVVSDADVKNGMKSQFGIDLNGNILDRGKFEIALPKIKSLVKRNLADLPLQVSNDASGLLDARVVGKDAKIVWRPTPLHRDQPAPMNVTQALGGVDVASPTDAADFERRAEMEKVPMFKGRQLPQYDKEAVQTFSASTVGLGAEQIRAVASQALKDYADTWAGTPRGDATTTRIAIEVEQEKALKLAEKAEKALVHEAQNKARGLGFSGKPAPTMADMATLAARQDIPLTDAPDALERTLEVALQAYEEAKAMQAKGNGPRTRVINRR